MTETIDIVCKGIVVIGHDTLDVAARAPSSVDRRRAVTAPAGSIRSALTPPLLPPAARRARRLAGGGLAVQRGAAGLRLRAHAQRRAGSRPPPPSGSSRWSSSARSAACWPTGSTAAGSWCSPTWREWPACSASPPWPRPACPSSSRPCWPRWPPPPAPLPGEHRRDHPAAGARPPTSPARTPPGRRSAWRPSRPGRSSAPCCSCSARPSAAFLVNAGTFAVSALAMLSIPAGAAFAPARSGERSSVIDDVVLGARALRAHPAASGWSAPTSSAASSTACRRSCSWCSAASLGFGDAGYGYVLAGMGVGGILGTTLAPRAARSARPRRVLVLALLVVGGPVGAHGDHPVPRRASWSGPS